MTASMVQTGIVVQRWIARQRGWKEGMKDCGAIDTVE